MSSKQRKSRERRNQYARVLAVEVVAAHLAGVQVPA